MKTVLAFAVFAMMSSAHALQVNDSVTYSVARSNGGVEAANVEDVTVTVLSINGDAYHAVAVSAQTGQTRDMDGKISEITTLTNIFNNCEKFGGTLTKDFLIPGVPQVCHLVQGNQDVELSPQVPFGVARQVTIDSLARITSQVTSYSSSL